MDEKPASEQINDIITMYGGWKAELLTQLRAIIHAADPEIVEEVKWKMKNRPEGLPVWSHNGMICMTETFKADMKLVFLKGPALKDPQQLFNARLDSSKVRAIEFHAGDPIDKAGITALIHEAIALNTT